MRSYAVVMFVLSVLGTPLLAQDPLPKLDSIGPGCCTLRVRAPEGRAEGKYQGKPAAGRIALTPCKGNLCPPVGSIDATLAVPPGARIEMYAGRAAGQGAIWGALAGAVAVTAIWLGDQDLDMSVGEKVAAGIPLGALAGGAVGALIGALFPHWRPVQP
jgi:hypothetical protein